MSNKIYDQLYYQKMEDLANGNLWATVLCSICSEWHNRPPCYPKLKPEINDKTRKRFDIIYHFRLLKSGKVICLRRFINKPRYLKGYNHYPGKCLYCDYK